MLRKYTEEQKDKEDILSVQDLQKTTEKAALAPPVSPGAAAPGNPGVPARPPGGNAARPGPAS